MRKTIRIKCTKMISANVALLCSLCFEMILFCKCLYENLILALKLFHSPDIYPINRVLGICLTVISALPTHVLMDNHDLSEVRTTT